MKIILRSLMLLPLVLALAPIPPAHADYTISQEVNQGWVAGGPDLAQSFTTLHSGVITQIDIYFADTNIWAGLDLEVQPVGQTSGIVNRFGGPRAPGWAQLELTAPIPVSANTQYMLNLTADSVVSVGWAHGDRYPGGSAWIPSWGSLPDDDLMFRVHVDTGSATGPDVKMHHPQWPDPNGWDVRFGSFPLGDDWRCTETGTVDEIDFWLSWQGDGVDSLGTVGLTIWSDSSGPGSPLWSQDFYPGSGYTITKDGTGNQGWYDPYGPVVSPNDHNDYYKISIDDIQDPFVQQEGETYWLLAYVAPETSYHGWKTSDDHWGRPAVYRGSGTWLPLSDPVVGGSLDMAFVIRGTPTGEATIRSVRSGSWRSASTWNLNRVPNSSDDVEVMPSHTVTLPDTATIRSINSRGTMKTAPGRSAIIRATGLFSNLGLILGTNGGTGVGASCGRPGSSLTLYGKPFLNLGTIRAGDGGDGTRCGGRGGTTSVNGCDTTNSGTICAGAGGDVLGPFAVGKAGDGGTTYVSGKWCGSGQLVNQAFICAGDGGSGHPAATMPQSGGCGGDLVLLARPQVILGGGHHRAGGGGAGTGGGGTCGDGQVWIEPNSISAAGPETEIWGGDVVICGGDDWVLDLSGMATGAISATRSITLAVGAGGAVDLSGNAGQVFQAGEQVVIASDAITLDLGTSLADVAGTNAITVPSQILYNVSLVVPDQLGSRAGVTVPVDMLLLNGGPVTDTYTLNQIDSAGWLSGTLPSPVEVGGLEGRDLVLHVAIPPAAEIGDRDAITVTATSQSEPGLVESSRIELRVNAVIYLPTVLKD